MPSDGTVMACILVQPGATPVHIWGLTPAERLRRAVVAAGVPATDVRIDAAVDRMDSRISSLVAFRGDYVFDDRLVRALIDARDVALEVRTATGAAVVAAHVDRARADDALALLRAGGTGASEAAGAGLRRVGTDELAQAYTPALRRVDPAFVVAVSPQDTPMIERRIFDASYKGVTDLVTKWVWPMPARWVTGQLAHRGIRPNAVTLVSWVLAVATGVLFAGGWFGLGLALGWIMTFLDTVDGKLARVTLTSSRIGDVLDHGLDLLHPPFWYLAWAVGLPAGAPWRDPAVAVTLGGYVIGRLIEGLFLLLCKTEIHCWRPVDSWFRTVTARRNPNMILLTVGMMAARPDLGLVAVAVWTAVSIAFHAVRLGQALAARRRGRSIESWLVARAACESTGRR